MNMIKDIKWFYLFSVLLLCGCSGDGSKVITEKEKIFPNDEQARISQTANNLREQWQTVEFLDSSAQAVIGKWRGADKDPDMENLTMRFRVSGKK
jgi:hypothetical protein